MEVLLQAMKTKFQKLSWAVLAAGLVIGARSVQSKDADKRPLSYAPVDIHETFPAILSRMAAAKPEIMKRHMALREQRYDLSDRPAPGVRMSGADCTLKSDSPADAGSNFDTSLSHGLGSARARRGRTRTIPNRVAMAPGVRRTIVAMPNPRRATAAR